MGSNGPFGFDPDDFDQVAREVRQGLRDALGRFLTGEDTERRGRGSRRPETAGDAGDGVWAIYTVGGDGNAHVEQVFATELDALRAHKDNTDPARKVRFLPYGIAVSVLDASEDTTEGAGPETQ